MKTASSISDASVLGAIQRQLQLRPRALALRSERVSVNFDQLHQLDKQLGIFLRSRGVSIKDPVLVLMPRGIEMGLVSIGVMNHAICVPVNPDFTPLEIDELLASLKPQIILAAPSLAINLEESEGFKSNISVVRIALDAEKLTWVLDNENFKVVIDESFTEQSNADGTALMLLTSGSTSTPKLVPLSHKNISTSSRNLIESLNLTSSDCCLNTMTMFHVGGLLDLLVTPLSIGMTVICPEETGSEAFYRLLSQFRPTWYQAVPTMLLDILAYAELNTDSISKNSTLRLIRSVSSPLSAELCKKVEAFFEVPVIEIYGMTETAGVIASNPLPPEMRKSLSVGKIVGNTEVKIIDGQNNPLGPNEEGEIIVSGDSVFAGYLDHTEANRDCFIGTWFKTGDTGLIDEDGYLFLKGRVKDIINRGGEKISPIEIDRVIEAHPGILEAAAFAVDHPSLGEEVAAAVVLEPAVKLNEQELRSFLSERLAAYKEPQEIIFLDRLPRNSGGKKQRHLLSAEINRKQHHGSTIEDLPDTELEKIAARLWKKILNVQRVNRHDDFFELGGDSLRATLFVAQLEKKINKEIDARVIYERPVLTEFCRELEALSLYRPSRASQSNEALREELRRLMAFWPGSRLKDDSLIVGHNVIGSKTPIFWCTNSLDHFVEQIKYFDADQPIYGMVSLMESKFRSVENNARVAEIYTEEILQLNPGRELIIGAWCEGAKIMINTANQLEQKGIEVKLLFIQDNFIPQFFHKPVAFFFSNYAMNRYRDQYHNPDFGIGKYYTGGFVTHYDDIEHTAYYQDSGTMKKFVTDLNQKLESIDKIANTSGERSPELQPQLLRHKDYKSRISLHRAPLFFDVNSSRNIEVEITNESQTTWQSGAISGITLMTTWLDFGYNRMAKDGELLAREVAPGEKITMSIQLKPPQIVTRTKLLFVQIDLVDDGVARFSSYASKAVRFPTLSAPLMLYPAVVHRGNRKLKRLENATGFRKLKPTSIPIRCTNQFIKLVRILRNITYKYTNQ